MKIIKVSIIIVYHSGKKSLINCLDSIYRNIKKVSYEVTLVDNSSGLGIEKDIKKNFRNVRYVRSPENLGYGAGNNLGAKHAKGKYLLILNPDTEIIKGSVENLTLYLDKNRKVGIVAPNLLTEEKKPFERMGSRRLTPLRGIFVLSLLNKYIPNNRYSKEYYLVDKDKSKLRQVDAVPGSAFMIKKSLFKEIGMFDKKLFMYFEEHDLGIRVQEAGYKIVIEPKAKIIHYWTSSKISKKLKDIHLRSRFYYFQKHFGFIPAFIVESIARFDKWKATLFIIMLLSIFSYSCSLF